ncbi:oligosaccharide flippase family protein [Dyella silvae]|uniref:oligosaccharide flippase family protein n=1 Tax=Dyella silvae TaxID=2994424 RepID=UPI0022649F9E|nr:oligosaccharide flippase family protein [Dyella silvae]
MTAARPANRRLDVLRSITIVSVSSYIEFALGLFVSVWIARALGPADFGRYAFTVWLCGWLIVCSNHALTTSSTKFIAEADGAGSTAVASHIAYRLNRVQHVSTATVMLLFLLVLLVARPTEWHDALLPAAALVVVATVSKANYAMWVAIAKGQERFETEAIATVLAGIIGVGLVISATLANAGLLAFVGIFTISCLLLNLINRIAYRHYCQPFTDGPVPDDLQRRLTRHLKLTATLILIMSFKAGTIEVFLLNTFATSTAVGFFAIAGTLTKGAVQLFSVGLTTTLLPYMAKSFGERGHAHTVHFLGEATRFYWAVGLMIAGLGLVTTPDIVTLMYGHRYADAIPAIEAMLVLAGLLLIGNGIAAYQTVVDRQDDRIRIAVISLCLNAALGILLVPALGLLGAVLTYAATRLSELVLSIFYLRKATTGGLPVAAMARLFGVGAVATAVAWAVTASIPSLWAFLLGGAVFVGIFVPASVLVRYWGDDDFRLLASIANRFGAPGRIVMRGLNSLHGQGANT